MMEFRGMTLRCSDLELQQPSMKKRRISPSRSPPRSPPRSSPRSSHRSSHRSSSPRSFPNNYRAHLQPVLQQSRQLSPVPQLPQPGGLIFQDAASFRRTIESAQYTAKATTYSLFGSLRITPQEQELLTFLAMPFGGGSIRKMVDLDPIDTNLVPMGCFRL